MDSVNIDKIFYCFLAILIIISGVIIWGEETDRIGFKCTKHTIVTDIVSVYYRSATIMTENGTYTLNQPKIKDGDKICIEGMYYNKIFKSNRVWIKDDDWIRRNNKKYGRS